jgi:hypothetical protein
MTTVRKCFETPAIGSTVSEHAGPEKCQNIITGNYKNYLTFSLWVQGYFSFLFCSKDMCIWTQKGIGKEKSENLPTVLLKETYKCNIFPRVTQ